MTKLRYELPDANNFRKAILLLLKQNGFGTLASLLSDSTLSFETTTTYAYYMGGSIIDAFGTFVVFNVPTDKYEKAVEQFGTEAINAVVGASGQVMPKDSGYEITGAKIAISLEPAAETEPAFEDVNDIISELSPKVREIIPNDILEKAKEMSEVYLYTYCAENLLRSFIVKVAKDKLGFNYLNHLKFSKDMRNKITSRKDQQEKKKWMSARGDSDIYYLDIDD